MARGTPSLAGDGLLSLAFYVLSQTGNAKVMQCVSRGALDMVSGQSMDINGNARRGRACSTCTPGKTGALIRAAVLAGAYSAGASETGRNLAPLTAFAEHFGLLFQITDDILDVTGEPALLGKTAGKDARENKCDVRHALRARAGAGGGGHRGAPGGRGARTGRGRPDVFAGARRQDAHAQPLRRSGGRERDMDDKAYPLLSGINGIEDFLRLPDSALDALAGELRARMIEVVGKTGGHLASSLGAVELIIAMHRVFSSPKDRLVFDVGHQAYAHKLLTGRNARFDTLRTEGGVSGFPKRAESVHDAFDTGHASTAVSAALGMARAMQLRGEEGCAVALVGDGALSGGMAFEALNDAGASEAPLVVILNDNGMSIAANVGSLRRSLLNMRTSQGYLRFKRAIVRTLDAGRWAAPSRTAWRSSKTASRISCCRTCSLRSWALPIWAPSTGTTSASWCACCAARGRCAARAGARGHQKGARLCAGGAGPGALPRRAAGRRRTVPPQQFRGVWRGARAPGRAR